MTILSTVTTIREVRQALLPWREAGETVALVPTMGALHRGHRALVERAKTVAQRVIVSIFVNPTQFGPNEDLSKYPRQLAADQEVLTAAGCDVLYAPDVRQMYPEGFATSMHPGPLATVLEGAFRPGHFAGVATVVMKLFLQMLPDAALFGEKDFQQLLVIRRVVRDLDLPVHILSIPTVREDDGLALSSRNAYLSPEERKHAAFLPRVLDDMVRGGATVSDFRELLNQGRNDLKAAGFVVDYLEIADAETLQPVTVRGSRPLRVLVAARLGKTRLIDNKPLNIA